MPVPDPNSRSGSQRRLTAGNWPKHVLHAFLIFDFSNTQESTHYRRSAKIHKRQQCTRNKTFIAYYLTGALDYYVDSTVNDECCYEEP